MKIIEITRDNIADEHICCAISDKKCREGYDLKKDLLGNEFDNGYRFFRLNERCKVFIEFGPSEFGWAPVNAPNYTLINCLWVSGKYKGSGWGKKLLEVAESESKKEGRDGLITIAGKKKFHFMSDTKWLLKQGFEICDETDTGFVLLVKRFKDCDLPSFKKRDIDVNNQGLTVYYSNRCPFTEYYVNEELSLSAKKRGLNLNTIKLNSYKVAQESPTPGTIFSLYYNGRFVTTDVSICLDKRFDKILKHP